MARGDVTHIAATDDHSLPCDDGTSNCHIVVESKFGDGPKVRVRVRDDDVVFHDRDLTVWRYRPDVQFAAH